MIARKPMPFTALRESKDEETVEKPISKQAETIANWISLTLRLGVGLSLLLLIVGTILTFRHHPEYYSQQTSLVELTRSEASFPHSVKMLEEDLNGGHGQAIVTLGLLVLIATPIVRVAISTLTFLHERDWPFTLITLSVLGLLILSMALGKVHG